MKFNPSMNVALKSPLKFPATWGIQQSYGRTWTTYHEWRRGSHSRVGWFGFSKCQRMAQRFSTLISIDFLHSSACPCADAGRVVWDVLYGSLWYVYGMSGMCHGAVGWTSKTLAATRGGKASSLLPENGWWMGVSKNRKTIPKGNLWLIMENYFQTKNGRTQTSIRRISWCFDESD